MAVAAEEEEAKEVAKLRELEEQVAVQEQRVVEELERLARLRDKTNISTLFGCACGWALARKAMLKATASPGRCSNTGRLLVFQQFELQQSFMILAVPQIQFINRLCEHSSCAGNAMVRIVILVVLALHDFGGSCSTCCAEI